MQDGMITLNGVTEAQATKILQLKEKNEGHHVFSLALAGLSERDPHGKPVYNGVTLSWRSDLTLKFILSLVQSLLE